MSDLPSRRLDAVSAPRPWYRRRWPWVVAAAVVGLGAVGSLTGQGEQMVDDAAPAATASVGTDSTSGPSALPAATRRAEKVTTTSAPRAEATPAPAAAPVPAVAARATVTVTRVVDGDTFLVGDARFRIAGIDAPELSECHGPAARQDLVALLSGPVELEPAEVQATDAYSRHLVYPHVGGRNVGAELVRQGAAEERFYGDNAKYRPAYLAAQAEAQQRSAGLWGPCPLAADAPTAAAPQPAPPATPARRPAPAPTTIARPASGGCHPSYAGACVPIASDVDCAGGSGNGPEYVSGPVRIVGPDVYELDGRDGDGLGCG
jgi:endonuclease YncB( thermonuclease family)